MLSILFLFHLCTVGTPVVNHEPAGTPRLVSHFTLLPTDPISSPSHEALPLVGLYCVNNERSILYGIVCSDKDIVYTQAQLEIIIEIH